MTVPDFLIPWLGHFYDPLEIDLLQLLRSNPLEKKDVIEFLIKKEPLLNHDRFLDTAWKRGVIQILDDKKIALEDFHTRFDYWVLFEGWKDLPFEIRDKLNNWELDHYITSHVKQAQDQKKGLPRNPAKIYPEYLLLDEVETLFKKIPRFYLWPCNCRSMMKNCHQSEYTCIRFSNDRDIGWEISRPKALSIVKKANKIGLMQSAEIGLDDQGNITGALCNCCNDCCFPHLLSKRCNVEKFWPISRYVANSPTEDCNKCGKCVSRCPFGIISQEKEANTKQRQTPVITVDLCRGCGVCSMGCPEHAIKMEKINSALFENEFNT